MINRTEYRRRRGPTGKIQLNPLFFYHMNLDICNKISEKILLEGKYSDNEKYTNLFEKDKDVYAMGFVFTKDGVSDLLSEHDYLKPFVDETIDADMFNAFYLNALVVKNGNSVEKHLDTTLSHYVGHLTTAKKVSVLYLKVPDDMVGGQLNIYDGNNRNRIRPETGKLISFSGENPHSVSSTFTDHERISLVLESYYLENDSYSKIPKFKQE